MPSIRKIILLSHGSGGFHAIILFQNYGSCLLRRSILLSNLCPGSSISTRQKIWVPTPSTHYHSNAVRDLSRSYPCKINTYQLPEGRNAERVYLQRRCTWTLGLGLQIMFSPDISTGKIVEYLILEGFGTGLTFQTNMGFGEIWSLIIPLVAAQATSPEKDRAVVTGACNCCRTIRGAFGSRVDNTAFLKESRTFGLAAHRNNVLALKLAADTPFSPELWEEVLRSSLALPDTLTVEQMTTVMNAYIIPFDYQ